MAGNTRQFNLPVLFPFQMDISTSGTPESLGVKLEASTIAFNDNDPEQDTITDSASGLIHAGFEVGDEITVSGSSSNDGTYTIGSVEAGTITLHKRESLTTEVAGSTITLKAPKVIPQGVMLDIKAKNGNTGLVYMGNSSARANSGNSVSSAFTLRNNEDIEVQVTSTDKIWLDVDTDGEGVEVIMEMNDKSL